MALNFRGSTVRENWLAARHQATSCCCSSKDGGHSLLEPDMRLRLYGKLAAFLADNFGLPCMPTCG
jgi:hypothetical protein